MPTLPTFHATTDRTATSTAGIDHQRIDHQRIHLNQCLDESGLTSQQVRAITNLIQYETQSSVREAAEDAYSKMESYQSSALTLMRQEINLRLRSAFFFLGAGSVVIWCLLSDWPG